MTGRRGMRVLLTSLVMLAAIASGTRAQAPAPTPPPSSQPPRIPPPPPPRGNPPVPPPIEKLGDDRLRVGTIEIDSKRREITVPGVVNDAKVLEFVANTRGGFKAYESALTLDTNGITFNLALILIGCDSSRSILPTRHFDEATPRGDPLEIWVVWGDGAQARKVPAEDLVFNQRTREPLPRGPWVYTGSLILRDGRYLADVHGALIGFVHTPAPVIENPLPNGVGGFGTWVLNPGLGLAPGTAVRLIVRALPQ